ncbi:MAG TPA: His/Gly/Thr/Pro-type tRNA ligase C-terminal domain-containing protein [Flavipsychrobacter sp.]|nr:His/Gly/Thr/Pro-type tRNA ligase C-terminal domain-containing protein [Flavipsychrobacter sp.]
MVGSNSLINEAELLCIYQSAFEQLKVPVKIKINNRKILSAIIEFSQASDKAAEVITAIDKLDKIGRDGVENEFRKLGLNNAQIDRLRYLVFFHLEDPDKEISQYVDGVLQPQKHFLDRIESLFKESNIHNGVIGIQEIRDTIKYYESIREERWVSLEIDFTLARGLNYYTGVIVEVTTDAVKMGSIGGGGRYDDLTGLFGLKGLSGVGISFGIDRIYDVMEELNLFPDQLATGSKAMLVNFGGENETYALSVLKGLRHEGIAAEIYPEAAKFDKQMKYANKRNIPFVILPGDEEREKQMVSLKNFTTGEQNMLSISDVINLLKSE